MKIKSAYICLPIIILVVVAAGLFLSWDNAPQKAQTNWTKAENSVIAANSIEFEPAKEMRDPVVGSAFVSAKQASLGGMAFLFTDENKKDLFAAMYVQNLNVDWSS